MSKFTGYGRTNHIDFGDYVHYPYGINREPHIFKVVKSFQSNTYQDAPYTFNSEPKIHKGGLVPVLNIIHCGIDETQVITVKESDCIKLNI
ncbi:hypothetical protein ABE137_06975 [Brevibacillus laterosporus]|uniref:hypothetical protein n=1 Tax=Brevibacillus laterosporus TaxID=1465 RepID=UPI003D1E0C2B